MKKFVVARNEWCAKRTVNMVLKGRASDTALFPTAAKAYTRIKQMPAVKQEEYQVFQVNYLPRET